MTVQQRMLYLFEPSDGTLGSNSSLRLLLNSQNTRLRVATLMYGEYHALRSMKNTARNLLFQQEKML